MAKIPATLAFRVVQSALVQKCLFIAFFLYLFPNVSLPEFSPECFSYVFLRDFEVATTGPTDDYYSDSTLLAVFARCVQKPHVTLESSRIGLKWWMEFEKKEDRCVL